MAVRESDSNLDYWLYDGAWQTIVGLLVLPAVILTVRHWHALIRSLARWGRTRSCGLMIAGLVTVLLFSRLLGMESMWQHLMSDHYIRSVKNLAEEGTELIGYSLILIAALDQAQNRSI